MPTFLDDKVLSLERPTVAGAIEAAVTEAGRRGRIVVEATAGGEPLPEGMLEHPPEDPVPDDLRFVSVEPKALIRVTLMDARDALDQARQAQTRSAELIQSGKLEQSLEPLGEALETWRIVRDAVDKSMSLLGPAGAEMPSAAGLPALIGRLTERLEEVKRSLAGQDWSALADALAYDMDEQAGEWKDMLAGLADALRPAP